MAVSANRFRGGLVVTGQWARIAAVAWLGTRARF